MIGFFSSIFNYAEIQRAILGQRYTYPCTGGMQLTAIPLPLQLCLARTCSSPAFLARPCPPASHLWFFATARCPPWVDPIDSKLLDDGFISWWATGNKSPIIRSRVIARAPVLATQLMFFWAFPPIILLWIIHMADTTGAFAACQTLFETHVQSGCVRWLSCTHTRTYCVGWCVQVGTAA